MHFYMPQQLTVSAKEFGWSVVIERLHDCTSLHQLRLGSLRPDPDRLSKVVVPVMPLQPKTVAAKPVTASCTADETGYETLNDGPWPGGS